MNDRHRKILHQCWSEFRKDLEPKNLLPELTSVVNVTDAREVLEKSTRNERVDKLVTEILPRRGNNAFNVFVEGLKKTQPHLAVTLKNAGEVQYNASTYEKTEGAAKESPVSAVIVNLYMKSFIEQAVT
ncbi:hypothetical protein pdam_00013530 [Pocillopora damicornis]|uniref:CARD domain-containing protein n=1 Tax=Pocillopora damicornis TaxID=46731 RepID=A0A3M6TCU0_POCDA|nr:hypothetical protein pdam_00013530 [Pocillopora damicornis]